MNPQNITDNKIARSDSTPLSNDEIPYTECPYIADANSVTACLLWCELREASLNETCTDAPVCPYENSTTPYDSQLCDLWTELEGLKIAGTSNTMLPQENVTCPYLEEDLFSSELCSLWCEVQGLKNNQVCITPCPYEGMIDGELFCQLWNELNEKSEEALQEALAVNPTGTFSVGPTPSPTYAVSCIYDDNPTNATGLCDLWCQIIAYDGGQCIEEGECPYLLQVSEPLLCSLWNEIQLANTVSVGSTPSSNYTDLIGPGTADSNNEIPYTECPYITDPNSVTACLLWCELREASMNETCTDAPICPYENSTTPYDAQLCDLWTELEGLKIAGTSNTMLPQENVTCPILGGRPLFI